MTPMHSVPDWETDPVETICAPVSATLCTRVQQRDDLTALRKQVAAYWRRRNRLIRQHGGTFRPE